jgi:hypothetical protein
MSQPFNREGLRILLAGNVYPSKKDLRKKGGVGDKAEFDSAHTRHEYEITEIYPGSVFIEHRENGESKGVTREDR